MSGYTSFSRSTFSAPNKYRDDPKPVRITINGVDADKVTNGYRDRGDTLKEWTYRSGVSEIGVSRVWSRFSAYRVVRISVDEVACVGVTIWNF